ncbi:hypothetical protein [Xanthomonas sacchari]|nr:hypothetical protein [Xanthomonas sacchari]MDV0438287.1 hypothetical protein [Xanthomonas sacchari]
MNLPTVYQLDRNVVIEIEKSMDLGCTPFINQIRAIDQPGNIVSALLSMTEGHVKERRDEHSFALSFERETKAFDAFFKYAKTDTLSLKEVFNLASYFINEVTSSQDVDLEFIKKIQKEFALETSRDLAKSEYEKARSIIIKNNRKITDKISLMCIAAALGSKQARGVLKPKNNPTDSEAFNALADIEKISLVSYMRVLSITMGTTNRIEIFSFDQDLIDYYALVKPESAIINSLDSPLEVSYSVPIKALLDSMLHLNGKAKLRDKIKTDLEQA